METQEKSKKPGRPNQLNEELTDKILELAKKGKTNKQIAQIIGISPQTIYYWQRTNDQFKWAFSEAKSAADDLVEASLFRKAIGYTCPETKVFQYEGQIIEHTIQKHYAPDTTAGIFWLKNRRPEEWRERVENVNKNYDLEWDFGDDDDN